MSPTETVLAALTALFVDFDPEAAGKLLKEDYIQHNPAVPTGAAPILGFLPALKESGLKPTVHRAISEGDLVVLHVTYENAQAFGAETQVAFDIFRVEDGKLAEHWDNLQPAVPADQTASGQLDDRWGDRDHRPRQDRREQGTGRGFRDRRAARQGHRKRSPTISRPRAIPSTTR